MDNAICNIEGMCENFFHPRKTIVESGLYQAPENFDASPASSSSLSSPSDSNKTTMESPVNRLLRERLRWIDEQKEIERKESEKSEADKAADGLKQMFIVNAQRESRNSGRITQTNLKVHEQVMLETIWKKQMDKSTLKTNLFGGRMPTSELSVNQVRLGKH